MENNLKSGGTLLVTFSKAHHSIMSAKTVNEITKMIGLTQALKAISMSKELQRQADALYLRARRRRGEITSDMPKQHGARGAPGPGRGKKNGVVKVDSVLPTYADLGIKDKRDISKDQQIAEIPVKKFEKYLVESTKLTFKDLFQLARLLSGKKKSQSANKKKRSEKRAKDVVRVSGKDVKLPKSLYHTIVIDPPWDWGDEKDHDQFDRSRPPYATMPIEELLEFPVETLAYKNCHIYLWITNRSLPKGFSLLEEWGFRYITCLTWVKPSFGLGNYYRGQSEHSLFGVRGSQALLRHDVGTIIRAPRGSKEHSSKPNAAYEIIKSCSPGPRIDIFARSKHIGFDSWPEIEEV